MKSKVGFTLLFLLGFVMPGLVLLATDARAQQPATDKEKAQQPVLLATDAGAQQLVTDKDKESQLASDKDKAQSSSDKGKVQQLASDKDKGSSPPPADRSPTGLTL